MIKSLYCVRNCKLLNVIKEDLRLPSSVMISNLIWWEGASSFKSKPFISLEVYTKQHWLFFLQHLCIIDLLSNTISLGKFLIPLWGFCLVKGKKSKGIKHSNCVLGGFDDVPGYRMTEVFMVSSFSKGSLDKKCVGWECCVNAGTKLEYTTGFLWQQQNSHLQCFSPSQY